MMRNSTINDSKPENPNAMPVVAIVGRPNVGKSALFNRLVGSRQALVEDVPGTTRDRLYADVQWRDRHFMLVDTGGLDPHEGEGYAPQIRSQAEQAMAEADVLLFVVDVLDGPTSLDRDLANLLRGAEQPVVLLANKADNENREQAAVQFYELGLGESVAISAYHDIGIREMMQRVVDFLPESPSADEAEAALPIAIVGRPNVGKSMLLNAILGEERVIVSEQAGTTRDAIDVPFAFGDHRLVIIDTAGIRRRGRIEVGIEKHSVLRAQRAIQRSEVAILVIDANDGVTAQDTHVAGFVLEEHRGMVVVVNKWDLIPQDRATRSEYAKIVAFKMRFASWAPICFVSAKESQGIQALLDKVVEVSQERRRRISTGQLNAVIRRAVAERPPAARHGQRVKILYVTQAAVNPPTFVFFANDASLVHFSYRRYLENILRESFGFQGTALKLTFRSRSER